MAEGVPQDQNSQQNLELLAAQKVMYSKAKRLVIWQWVLTVPVMVILSLTTLYLNSDASFYEVDASWLLGIVGALVTVFEVFVLGRWTSGLQEEAAKTQEMFDTSVLKLPWNDIVVGTRVEQEVINQHAREYKRQNPSSELIQNWYPEVFRELPEEGARLLCQRINSRWDSELRTRFSRYLLFAAIILFAVLFVTGLSFGFTLRTFATNVVLPFFPFLMFALKQHQGNSDSVKNLKGLKERLEDLWRQVLESRDAGSDLYAISRDVQNCIFSSRKTSPLILDRIYFKNRTQQEQDMNDTALHFVGEYKSRLG